jgi:hypothetical protein
MTDGMRWRGALYGLASSAREGGRGGHMTMMMTGAVGEAPGGGARSGPSLHISYSDERSTKVRCEAMFAERLPASQRLLSELAEHVHDACVCCVLVFLDRRDMRELHT